MGWDCFDIICTFLDNSVHIQYQIFERWIKKGGKIYTNMSGEIILRLGGYKEIDIYEFNDWLHDTYFKSTNNGFDDDLFMGRFDVDVTIIIDELEDMIKITADLVDVEDIRGSMTESLKREIREISRGNGDVDYGEL